MIEHSAGEVVVGGGHDAVTRRIEPTVVRVDSWDDAGMQQETFGPVLWVKSVQNVEEAVDFINGRPKSLSLYMFSEDRRNQDFVVNNTSSGGMQINAVVGYATHEGLPFGGVGASGMGAYHGQRTFDTFCHKKAVSR